MRSISRLCGLCLPVLASCAVSLLFFSHKSPPESHSFHSDVCVVSDAHTDGVEHSGCAQLYYLPPSFPSSSSVTHSLPTVSISPASILPRVLLYNTRTRGEVKELRSLLASLGNTLIDVRVLKGCDSALITSQLPLARNIRKVELQVECPVSQMLLMRHGFLQSFESGPVIFVRSLQSTFTDALSVKILRPFSSVAISAGQRAVTLALQTSPHVHRQVCVSMYLNAVLLPHIDACFPSPDGVYREISFESALPASLESAEGYVLHVVVEAGLAVDVGARVSADATQTAGASVVFSISNEIPPSVHFLSPAKGARLPSTCPLELVFSPGTADSQYDAAIFINDRLLSQFTLTKPTATKHTMDIPSPQCYELSVLFVEATHARRRQYVHRSSFCVDALTAEQDVNDGQRFVLFVGAGGNNATCTRSGGGENTFSCSCYKTRLTIDDSQSPHVSHEKCSTASFSLSHSTHQQVAGMLGAVFGVGVMGQLMLELLLAARFEPNPGRPAARFVGPSFAQENEGATLNRPARRGTVVFGVDCEPGRAFAAPLVARAWQQLGFDVVVWLVGDAWHEHEYLHDVTSSLTKLDVHYNLLSDAVYSPLQPFVAAKILRLAAAWDSYFDAKPHETLVLVDGMVLPLQSVLVDDLFADKLLHVYDPIAEFSTQGMLIGEEVPANSSSPEGPFLTFPLHCSVASVSSWREIVPVHSVQSLVASVAAGSFDPLFADGPSDHFTAVDLGLDFGRMDEYLFADYLRQWPGFPYSMAASLPHGVHAYTRLHCSEGTTAEALLAGPLELQLAWPSHRFDHWSCVRRLLGNVVGGEVSKTVDSYHARFVASLASLRLHTPDERVCDGYLSLPTLEAVFEGYCRCHAAILSGAVPARVVVFAVEPRNKEGWANRAGQLIMAFTYALLSRRALLVDWEVAFHLDIRPLFASPGFEWDYDKALERLPHLADLPEGGSCSDIVKNRHPTMVLSHESLTCPYLHAWMSRDAAAKPLLDLVGGRQSLFATGALSRLLLIPSLSLRKMMDSIWETHTRGFKTVGVAVRVGGLYGDDAVLLHPVHVDAVWHCAKQLSFGDIPTKFFLMTDMQWVVDQAQAMFGDRLLNFARTPVHFAHDNDLNSIANTLVEWTTRS